MAWTFEITTGKLYNPDGTFAAQGYSGGNCGKNPEGIDNPADECIKDVGPLPEGLYTFGTPVAHSQLGAFAIPLIPDPSNNMMGRGDFYMHGDTAVPGDASEGCIIMPPDTRHACAGSADNQLTVVAVMPGA